MQKYNFYTIWQKKFCYLLKNTYLCTIENIYNYG